MARRELPGSDCHAGWRAYRRSHVSLREADSTGRQLVQIRRGNPSAVTPQIAVPEVIGQNQDYIWTAIPSGGDSGKKKFSAVQDFILEYKLQCKLNLSCREGGSDCTERAGSTVGIGSGEIRVIEDVEELRAELQLHSFPW